MSDYLTDEEQIDKLRNWWARNGVAIVVAVLVAVLIVVGWRWYTSHRSDAVAQASDLYADYLKATGTERETIEATLAKEFPDSSYHVLVLLRDAKALVDAEDAAGALAKLEAALAVEPGEPLDDLIRLRIARLQQQLDQSAAALDTLSRVKSLGFRSLVLELKGDIHMARDEKDLAREAYAAAMAEAGDGSRRPILEMKAADTAGTDDA
ncbi:MAG: YfgM family protein [Pseudomonadales bacterium]